MLTVVIQAGGESRRMGQDKGLAPFLGGTIVERIYHRLQPLADEWLVITNHPDRYQFLGLPLANDLIPGRGALGGLYTALQLAAQPFVAVVACDMPFASPTLFAAERDLLLQTGADAVIPQNGGGIEPFHSVYRHATCLPAIQSALEAGLWRADAWFPQVAIHYMPVEEVQRYDPELRAFANVNTPEDLQLAEQLARQTP